MAAQNNFITYILVLFQRWAQKMNLHDDLYPGVISKMATRWKQENYDDIHLPASFKMPVRWQQRIIFMTGTPVFISRYT